MKIVETFYEKDGVATTQVHIRRTVNDKDQLESFDDVPSEQEFDRSGNIMRKVWHDGGVIHRCHSRGPAIVHEDKGKIFWEIYMQNGIQHRREHVAYTFVNPATKTKTQTWIEGGIVRKSLLHDKDGILIDARYYNWKGQLHNADFSGNEVQPAWFNKKFGKKFFLNGVEFSEEQMKEVAKIYDMMEERFYS